jgi:hypothetical protein
MKFPSHILLESTYRDKTRYLIKNQKLNLANSFILPTSASKFPTSKFKLFVDTRSSFRSNRNSSIIIFTNLLNCYFDIFFLRKEKIYTKLKYSRTPQYDIVSGGIAAIFAGFLGFLICEKFGLELLDSGDFYFAFMYVVFGSFFLKLFFRS